MELHKKLPGSFNNFRESNPELEPSLALKNYGHELIAYRQFIAERARAHIYELRSLGDVAIKGILANVVGEGN